MKTTKRLMAMLLTMIMVLSMTACGGSDGEAAGDKEGKTYKVGICQLVQHEALDAATKGFQDALKEELGDAVEFDLQNAQNDPATCATIVNGFVANGVDLILANATPALQAAAAGTGDIPILGTSVTEYGVALELDDFDGTVGGNISGTSDLAPLEEQAKMVKELLPDAKNIGLLYCSSEANSQYQVDEVKKYLEGLGFACELFAFSDSNDMAAVVENAAAKSDAIYVPTDNTIAATTGIVDNICAPKKIPVIAGEESACKGCGIATLSISYYDLGVATGKMAARVLQGEDISTMAIEYAPQFTKKYVASRATALGIEISEEYTAIEE